VIKLSKASRTNETNPEDYHLTIPRLPAEDRPREKLREHGPSYLTEAELLAIILRVGIPGATAVQFAQRILRQYGGLAGLAQVDFEELCQVKGLGPAKSAQIKAALELGSRWQVKPKEDGPAINSPEAVEREIGREMQSLDHEELRVLLLNTKNKVQKTVTVCSGSLNTTSVRVSEIFKDAIRGNCAAVILAHNHPSGDPTPSADDVRLTEEAVKAGKLLDIDVLDHLIFGRHGRVSLREKKLGFS
jgi:DNA repair protein RadC